MNYLIFDTETSGFANDNLPPQDVNQGRCMQFACVLVDDKFEELASFSAYSNETEYHVASGAFACHGITLDKCAQSGIPMKHILSVFASLLYQADVVVGFNIAFDKKIMETECALNGVVLNYPESLCLMQELTDVCKLPPTGRSKGRYKWPKLEEAHMHCIGESLTDAHDAMGDVRGTLKLLQWFKQVPNKQTALTESK